MVQTGSELNDTSDTTDNKNSAFESWQLDGTPFTIVKREKEYLTVMGKHLLAKHDTKEEAEKEAVNITWNRIVQVVAIFISEQEEVINLINNN